MPLGQRLRRRRRRAQVSAILQAVWAEVLGRPVTPGDAFLALGGNSLQAVRIVARVEEAFGVPVAMRHLLESATLAEMAERVTDALDAAEAEAGP